MADFRTVARPYARALFSMAQAAGDLQAWSSALGAAARVVEDAAASRFLGRPDLAPEDRTKLITTVCADVGGAGMLGTPAGQALLRLLDENERLPVLPAIAERFEQLKSQAENKIAVTLVAAVDIDTDVARQIAQALEIKLGRQVELEVEVDSTLIGGAVIKAEDMVIDGSVRSRLKRLAESLIE